MIKKAARVKAQNRRKAPPPPPPVSKRSTVKALNYLLFAVEQAPYVSISFKLFCAGADPGPLKNFNSSVIPFLMVI